MNLSQASENIVRVKKSGRIILPAKLLEFFPWLNQDNLIKAKPTAQGLLLQPFKTPANPQQKTVNKRKTASEILKEFAKLARKDKHPDVNLTEFIIKDRENH